MVLAKAGYDVWLGNNRGTRFSDKHVSLKNTDKNFWNFTWEEMGTKDTPKVIDYILKLTNQTKISFIGHSQGSTQLMAGAALLPAYYQQKIKVAIMLAPLGSMKDTQSKLLRFMANKVHRAIVNSFVETIRVYNLLPYNFAVTKKADKLCNIFQGKMCDLIISLFTDSNSTIDNLAR